MVVAPVDGTWRQEKPVTDERKNAARELISDRQEGGIIDGPVF